MPPKAVSVYGFQLPLRWTLWSQLASETVFGFHPDIKDWARAVGAYTLKHGATELGLAFAYCIMQSFEPADKPDGWPKSWPPTLEDLRQVPKDELMLLCRTATEAVGIGRLGPVPRKKNEEQGSGESDQSESSGTGT
jgi:hypothetical protein